MSQNWEVRKRISHPKGDNPFNNEFYGYEDKRLVLPNGDPARYIGVLIGPCVHVVALEDDGTTYIVEQPRPNSMIADETDVPLIKELPGGFKRPNLSHLESAQDQIETEIARRAGSLMFIDLFRAYPVISDEVDHVYLGQDLEVVAEREQAIATERDINIIQDNFGSIMDDTLINPYYYAPQTVVALRLVAAEL